MSGPRPRPTAARAAVVLAAVLAAGCGGPKRPPELLAESAAAARATSAGRPEEAARHYEAAARVPGAERSRSHYLFLAARAHARAGRRGDAARLYRALADQRPEALESAQARLELARDAEARGELAAAAAEYRRVVVDHPRSGLVAQAARHVARLAEASGGPVAARDALDDLARAVEGTEADEAVRFQAARARAAAAGGPSDREAALAAFLRLADDHPYPKGAHFDDALYEASLLEEGLGRRDRAVAHLERMLDERESAHTLGTYERPKYLPAIQRIAALHERAGDRARAREAWHRLATEFRTSVLRDDALWNEARLFREDGDAKGACAALDELVSSFPDSRYVPCATSQCPGVTRPKASRAPATCRGYLSRAPEPAASDAR